MQYQLDLFEEYNETKALLEHTERIEKQVHNVRRGLFARLGNMYKALMSTDDRVAALEVRLGEQEKEIEELREYISWMESVA